MSRRCEGELRASKGALIFIPDGTEYFLRVESAVELPEGFRAGRAQVTLRQQAELVRKAGHADDGIEPEHGVPSEVCGAVLETGEGEVVLDLGFPLHVALPEGASHEKRLFAVLKPPLLAEQAELL